MGGAGKPCEVPRRQRAFLPQAGGGRNRRALLHAGCGPGMGGGAVHVVLRAGAQGGSVSARASENGIKTRAAAKNRLSSDFFVARRVRCVLYYNIYIAFVYKIFLILNC